MYGRFQLLFETCSRIYHGSLEIRGLTLCLTNLVHIKETLNGAIIDIESQR